MQNDESGNAEWKYLRLTNIEVLTNIDGVMEKVVEGLSNPLLSP